MMLFHMFHIFIMFINHLSKLVFKSNALGQASIFSVLLSRYLRILFMSSKFLKSSSFIIKPFIYFLNPRVANTYNSNTKKNASVNLSKRDIKIILSLETISIEDVINSRNSLIPMEFGVIEIKIETETTVEKIKICKISKFNPIVLLKKYKEIQ